MFAEASWCVLPPVGGIAIYERFELSLHPIRLQIHTVLGTRILEYIWPSRSTGVVVSATPGISINEDIPQSGTGNTSEEVCLDVAHSSAVPSSRSFTELSETLQIKPPTLKRSRSFNSLPKQKDAQISNLVPNSVSPAAAEKISMDRQEALEMKQRSSQKIFIRVEISSIYLLLSIMKEDAFLCRNAKIRTRELTFRNQTFSFEELVGQFVPTDPSWRGWVKMALHQPLLPVLPVAREIISKTKWGSKQASKLLPSGNVKSGKLRRRLKPKDSENVS